MSLNRALALLSVLGLAGLSEAAAQFPSPPGQVQTTTSPQASPFPPPPGQSGASAAQPSSLPPSGQQRPASPGPFATPGAQAPNPFAPQPQGGGKNVCEQFPAIRAQAEKDASVIKAASDRKATREEICAAFNKFAGSEGKMVNFLATNQQACGVPPDAVKQVKSAHARTQQIRKQVCSTAPGPRAPSLSDALGGPILSDEPPKPGRGTFDTLTGNPLGR